MDLELDPVPEWTPHDLRWDTDATGASDEVEPQKV